MQLNKRFYLFIFTSLFNLYLYAQFDPATDALCSSCTPLSCTTGGCSVADIDAGGTVATGEICEFGGGGTTVTTGTIDVYGCLIISGTFRLSGATVTVHSGGYLEISNNLGITNDGALTVNAGGYIYVGADVNDGFGANDGSIALDGDMEVGGTVYINTAGSSLTGTGTLNADGGVDNVGGGTTDFDETDCADGNCCGGGGSCVLPVELISFNGSYSESKVTLNWQTATELNNRGFFIEKSLDGEIFETLGFVDGHGTTPIPQSYTYVDESPDPITYYRLLQVDHDGKFEYFPIKRVTADKMEASSFKIILSPNPFAICLDRLEVPTSNYSVKIHDLFGRNYSLDGFISADELLISINDILMDVKSGIYYVTLTSTSGTTQTIKIAKK